jgi:hypothetical protein
MGDALLDIDMGTDATGNIILQAAAIEEKQQPPADYKP